VDSGRPRTRPTIVDVARIAGVSPTTVSYVLSGREDRSARISEETTNRVLETVDNVGYIPNPSARALRLQRTNQVLFLGSRLTSLYSHAIANSIERGLASHRLACTVQIGSDLENVRRAIMTLVQCQADGLIVETSDEFVPVLQAAASNGHAIVAIGPTTGEPTFDVMSINDRPAIEEAMQHVVGRGYSHFLLLSSLPNVLQEHRVVVAYQQLVSLGIPKTSITLLHCPHDRIRAHRVALEVIPGLPHPLAVYAGADVSAIGILWACHQLRIQVPDTVAIIGHGNTPETHVTVPRLTSLGPVSSDFSKAAVLMATRLKNPTLSGRQIIEPCQLSIRESS
jgi:DNA-binding LacI/PurR family transcriptional regulator